MYIRAAVQTGELNGKYKYLEEYKQLEESAVNNKKYEKYAWLGAKGKGTEGLW